MAPRDEIRVNDDESPERMDASVIIYGTIDDQQQNTTTDKRLLDEENQVQDDDSDNNKPSNEYVLNIAFFTFVGFMAIQAVFALIANSQSMLADSEAMSIDALTYLFNMIAERLKKQPLTEQELLMSPDLCHYQRELRRLYLELFPPMISVSTLLCVTVFTLQDAFVKLLGVENGSNDDDVSVPVMLTFSSMNLLLDIVNVSCFARSHSLFRYEQAKNHVDLEHQGEKSFLLGRKSEVDNTTCHEVKHTKQSPIRSSITSNLNMCSAWTVS